MFYSHIARESVLSLNTARDLCEMKRKGLSLEERRRNVIDLHKTGKTIKQIKHRLSSKAYGFTFIYRTVLRFQETGSISEKPRGGRPLKTCTRHNVLRMKKRLSRNPNQSLRETSKLMGIPKTSGNRIAKEKLNLRPFKKIKAQLLTQNQIEARLNKCQDLLTRFAGDKCQDILFSDEKLFKTEQSHNAQNDRIWVAKRADIPNNMDRVTRAQGSAGVMVWGGICGRGKTPLVFVEKGVKINTKEYKDRILDPVVKPFMEAMFPDGSGWAPGPPGKCVSDFWMYTYNNPDLETCKKSCEGEGNGRWTCKSIHLQSGSKCILSDVDKDDIPPEDFQTCSSFNYQDASGPVNGRCMISKYRPRLVLSISNQPDCWAYCQSFDTLCRAISYSGGSNCIFHQTNSQDESATFTDCSSEYYELRRDMSESSTWEAGIADTCSTGGSFRRISTGLSLEDCKAACENETMYSCRSVSYDDTNCSLSEVTVKDDASLFTNCTGTDYFQRKGDYPDKGRHEAIVERLFVKVEEEGVNLGSALATITADYTLICAYECNAMPNCISFSYSTTQKSCKMFTISLQDPTSQWVTDPDFKSFE